MAAWIPQRPLLPRLPLPTRDSRLLRLPLLPLQPELSRHPRSDARAGVEVSHEAIRLWCRSSEPSMRNGFGVDRAVPGTLGISTSTLQDELQARPICGGRLTRAEKCSTSSCRNDAMRKRRSGYFGRCSTVVGTSGREAAIRLYVAGYTCRPADRCNTHFFGCFGSDAAAPQRTCGYDLRYCGGWQR
jgi:hypothetical protein